MPRAVAPPDISAAGTLSPGGVGLGLSIGDMPLSVARDY